MRDYLRLIQTDFEITVNGESMYPTLYHGEKVTCHKVRENAVLRCGNIIIFYNENEKRYVIHRIVEINKLKGGGYYYITKGDKNLVVDEYLVKNMDVRGVL